MISECCERTEGREKIVANTQGGKEETTTQPKSNCKHIIKHEVNRDDSIVEYANRRSSQVVAKRSASSGEQTFNARHPFIIILKSAERLDRIKKKRDK